MLTILEAVKLSEKYLYSKGIESPRTNAELLLADILHCKRLDLYLSFERPLAEDEISEYREYIKRRGKFEPLQYIIGSVEFYGYNLVVNKSVLIPRPETEILVEMIIEENKSRSGLKILDVGTGSGNIAIALAKNLPDPNILAIDIMPEALKVAGYNAESNNAGSCIKFSQIDIMDKTCEINTGYDIVVSNPPYISDLEYPGLQNEIVNYEPVQALTDYQDGLSFYKVISDRAKNLLKSGGKLYYETGIGQDKIISDIMIDEGYSDILIKKDLQNINRVIRGIIK